MKHKELIMKCGIKKIMRVSAIAFGIAVFAQGMAKAAQSFDPESEAAGKTAVQFDFKYISSDPQFNVFDDGVNTRILMPGGSLIPVITTLKPAGEVLLTPKVDGTALVLDGVHLGLKLIWANGKTVAVQYQGANQAKRQGQAAAFGAVPTQSQFQSSQPPVKTAVVQVSAVKSAIENSLNKQMRVDMPQRQDLSMGSGSIKYQSDAVEIENTSPTPQSFELTPPETVRDVLQRWSNQAKWTFGPSFYTATGDIPVVAPANLGTDYKTAVRTLLESTAMGDMPLQPCFYANNVLRVVPRQELCSRP